MILNKQKLSNAWLIGLAIASISFAGSCKKKDDPAPQNSSLPSPNYPKPTDADAILVAVKTSAPSPVDLPKIPGMPTEEITFEYGTGVALFKGNSKADQVLLNDTELKFSNGTHFWMPDLTNITNPANLTGINLNGNITWKITNPRIDKTLSGTPGMPRITSGKTIDKSQSFTISNTVSNNAQKVLYTIIDEKGKLLEKEQNGNSTSCTFTSTELATLTNSKFGIVQASAYIISNEQIAGKKVYFVRQSTYNVITVEIK